jgi:hydrogenase-4 component B
VNAIVGSLGILGGGVLWSLLLLGRPRWSLAGGLCAVGASALVCAGAALAVLTGGTSDAFALTWPLPLGAARLAVDGLSAWFLLTIAIVSASVAIFSWGYWQDQLEQRAVSLFSALLCVMVAAMVLVVCAADVVLFLAGWELMSLAAFLLIGLHHREGKARRGAWMYLIATHLGTALFVLPMFGVLAGRGGTTSFASFGPAMSAARPATCAFLFLLGLIGFGTKAGFMPMHVWLPAAHPVAPTPISALLSGVVVKTGIYGLLRLLTWLPPLPVGCAVTLLIMAMVSGVVGVLFALAQHDIKRLLAYHTVENIGIIGIGIGMGMLGQTTGHPALSAVGYAGALLHVLNHALFKGLLFMSGGAVIHATGTGEIERLGGLVRSTPINATLFLVGAVAICGLPPLNGFVSEWLIYGSLFRGAARTHGLPAALPVLGLISLALMGGLALACFAKVFSVVFLGAPRDTSLHGHTTPRSMLTGMAILGLLCVSIGVLPGAFVPLMAESAGLLTRQPNAQLQPAVQQVLAPLSALTVLAGLFTGVVILLILARRGLLRHAPAAAPALTWGCGYAFPKPRMQYTASSFAWSLVTSFRSLLWPRRELRAPDGLFPQPGHLETHSVDLAEESLFAPLFRGVARMFLMLRTLSRSGRVTPAEEVAAPHAGPFRLGAQRLRAAVRRGSIQVYLTFMVLTLVVLFVVEAWSSPRASRSAPPAPAPVSSFGGAGR